MTSNAGRRNLGNFFKADLISQFGSGMSLAASSWVLWEKTGQSEVVGLLAGITAVGGILSILAGGAVADRFDRKDILYWSNVCRALSIAVVLLLIVTTGFSKYYVFWLAVTNGIGWNLYLPTSRALIQDISEQGTLLKGNIVAEMSMQVGMFSAAAVAGFVYKYLGFNVILAIDISTFLISNVFIARIVYVAAPRSVRSIGLLEEALEGWRYLAADAKALALGVVVYVPFAAAACYNVALPGYVKNVLNGDAVVFGMIDMFYGVGAALSGVILLALSKSVTRERLVTLFFGAAIATVTALAFNRLAAGACLLSLLFGVCNPSIRTLLSTSLMEIVPRELIGRVLAACNLASMLMQLTLTYAVGRTMDSMGVEYGFAWMIGLLALGLCACWGCLVSENRLEAVEA